MTKFSIGLFVIVVLTTVILAAMYPEDFALALGTFVLGAVSGSLAAYHLYTSIHDKGFERSQQLAQKQIFNPASIMRETRMQEKQDQKVTPAPAPQQQAIPRFNITGLDNN